MIHLPEPDNYEDPIHYFRDSHKLIASVVDRFERELKKAKNDGIGCLLTPDSECHELLDFFVHVEPLHERDEERALFPIIAPKVPHTGFLSPGTPNRFMHEEHKVMQERAKALLSMWKSMMMQPQARSAEEEARFIEVGETLVKLFREHIAKENAVIYSAANDELLSPTERIAIMLMVKEHHGNQSIMPVLNFVDQPYGTMEETIDTSDAVSDQALDSEEEEEEESEDE